MKVLFGLTK